MTNNQQKIPEGASIRIFPLPNPKLGILEYPLQELRGLINYLFIANPPVAAAETVRSIHKLAWG